MLIDVSWSKGPTLDGIQCYLAEHDSAWLISTTVSPLFCFQAQTKESAIETATRGIAFFKAALKGGE